ncbi:hypothetical protein BG005_002914, partial [Podila minutissima]
MPPKRQNGNNPINPPTPSDLSTSTTPGLRSGKSFKFLNYDKGGNFNNKWLQWQSGHQLLHHREKMPQVIETDRPRMVTEMDRASFGFDTKILHPDDVPDLEFIPPPRVIESTVKTSYLNAGYGMRPALYQLDRVGICTTETVRLIKEVAETRQYADMLHRVVDWFKNTVTPIDAAFAKKFLEFITKEPRLYAIHFQPVFDFTGSYSSLQSLSSLCGSEWLAGDVLCGIGKFLTWSYGQDGKNIFMGPLCGGKPSILDPTSVSKLFAIVNIGGDHWGAMELCQGEHVHSVRFGDGLNKKIPNKAIWDVIHLLNPSQNKKKRDKWTAAMKEISRLPVQQQEDSSSCGILSAVAIEVAFNPKAAELLPSSILDLRLRHLRLLSGICKPEMDPIILEYWEQAKDKPKPRWTTRLELEKNWIHDIAKMGREDYGQSDHNSRAGQIDPFVSDVEDTVPDDHSSDNAESNSSDTSRGSRSHAKHQPRPRPLRRILHQHPGSSSKCPPGSNTGPLSSYMQPSTSTSYTGGAGSGTSSKGGTGSGTSSTGVDGSETSSKRGVGSGTSST